jgi:hypothetical protein
LCLPQSLFVTGHQRDAGAAAGQRQRAPLANTLTPAAHPGAFAAKVDHLIAPALTFGCTQSSDDEADRQVVLMTSSSAIIYPRVIPTS